jgi:transposase
MRKTKEILRQKWLLKLSHREAATSLGIGVGNVGNTMSRAKAVGLTWTNVEQMDEAELEKRLYGVPASPGTKRSLPSPEYIHQELHKTGVTLQLLHIEYLEQFPGGYKYTQFCEHYRRWQKKRGVTMRQIHRAGEKLFVDYSGKRPEIVDPQTGECIKVELFVAVLGASNYTYAEVTRTQQSHDWVSSHIRAFEYLGGAPTVVVPDQLRSGVSRPCWYEPGIHRTYEDMASHYSAVVIPARGGNPKDKAKVEGAVLIAQRWILARLRNQTFFSLDELNERIAELLEELNNRDMKLYGKSRRELFESLDRPAMKALPARRFVFGEWKIDASVNIDYHIQLDHRFYSVPYQLAGERVDARTSAMTVEIFFKGRRVASHARSFRRGSYTTLSEHMPRSHRAHAEWSPSRFINWAGKVGENTQRLVRAILEDRPHPEMGYRSCLGILRLAKFYGDERLERATARAYFAGARSYKHVEAILKNSLDQAPLPTNDEEPKQLTLIHKNLRGADYYKKETGKEC